jgi:hypothetical protein
MAVLFMFRGGATALTDIDIFLSMYKLIDEYRDGQILNYVTVVILAIPQIL